tara:strand:- start:384 stop:746 length:363 start_codon:yes stop_codon:yes gene_type:complete
MEKIMKINTINKNNENIKNIGIFLWIVSALMLVRTFIDPWMAVDLVIMTTMAYFAYCKLSRKSVYWASAYYVFDTLMFFDLIIDNPVSIIVRAAVLFWLIGTCFSIYKENAYEEKQLLVD